MSRQFRSDDTNKWKGGFGKGEAGDLTISGATTFPAGRSISTVSSGGFSVTTTNVEDFPVGSFVLIIQMMGTGAGGWELNEVATNPGGSGSGALTMKYPLQNTYTDSGASQAQMVNMPKYNNVTVNASQTWSAPNWGGNVGGIIAFFAAGTVTINGTILLSGNVGTGGTHNQPGGVGKGFPGGNGGNNSGAVGGQSGGGTGGTQATAGMNTANGAANGNGGGGGSAYSSNNWGGAGGGGGGHANAGSKGGTAQTGTGLGGNSVGNAALTSMVMGGGGGGGGGDAVDGGNGFVRGAGGGGGGGICLIIAANIVVHSSTGLIATNGAAGRNAFVGSGGHHSGGGGGAGGSVLIKCMTATLNTNRITATAGSGGSAPGGAGAGRAGGAGSVGRIHVDYSVSLSGTTNPTLNSTLDPTIKPFSAGGGAFLFNFV